MQDLSREQQDIIRAERLTSLGKLAAAVAHELNNPLSAILMYARLVERELPDRGFPEEKREELERYLSQVQKDARRCGDVVSRLLHFARSSDGTFARQHTKEIIENGLVLVRHRLEMAHIQLGTELSAEDDTIVCDANQLLQAFVALLLNAAEAMAGGGCLTVRTALAGGSIRVEFSDTGAGIPQEMLPHVFEPFIPVNGQQDSGGLGLAAAHAIVQRHGGSVDVESTVGGGTTFRVLLPRGPANGAPQER